MRMKASAMRAAPLNFARFRIIARGRNTTNSARIR